MVARQDLAVPAASQRFMAERAGSSTVEIDASHAATVAQPDAVADLIEEAATVVGWPLVAVDGCLPYAATGWHGGNRPSAWPDR